MSSTIKPVLGSQLQFGHPLATGLAGLWLFNEGSGNKVFDLSGNGNAGTFVGATHWVSGEFGSALDFRTSGRIDIPPYLCSQMTISLWFWFVSFDNLQGLIGRFNGCDFTNENGLYVGTDGTIYLKWYNTSNTLNLLNSAAVVSVGRWYHLVVTIKDGSQIIYLDGVNIASDTDSGDMKTGTHAVTLGEVYQGGILEGIMDTPMIYNRAFSPSEVALLHREPFCMFERDPIELWSAATLGAAPVGAAGIMTTNSGYWGPTF